MISRRAAGPRRNNYQLRIKNYELIVKDAARHQSPFHISMTGLPFVHLVAK